MTWEPDPDVSLYRPEITSDGLKVDQDVVEGARIAVQPGSIAFYDSSSDGPVYFAKGVPQIALVWGDGSITSLTDGGSGSTTATVGGITDLQTRLMITRMRHWADSMEKGLET